MDGAQYEVLRRLPAERLVALMRVSALQALKVAAAGAPNRLLTQCVREIHAALESRSVDEALKLIDRAWRTTSDGADLLAPLYGRLLLLDDRAPDAALRLLSQVKAPDADVAALTAHAYFKLRRSDDARRCLDEALKAYGVTSHGLLCRQASAALGSVDLQAPGWIGRAPTLEFVGELAGGHCADTLLIQAGDTVVQSSIDVTTRNGRSQFRFAAPTGIAGQTLRVSSRNLPLLGSGQRIPPEFALDGRIDGDRRTLSGWARVGWLPSEPLQLRVEDEHGSVVLLKSRNDPLPGHRWRFRLDLRNRGLRGDRIHVFARLPDGRWGPLPDAPFLLPGGLRVPTRSARLPRWRNNLSGNSVRPAPVSRKAPIDIIIPVYRGLRETLACIQSTLSTVGKHVRVIVVDDATVDGELAAALDDLAAGGRITLLRNESNLGFVRSVNRALTMSSERDIVLLNSDTLVFEGWLQRLCAAAYSEAQVGTVTPLSNDGSITSYPRRFGSAIDADEAAVLSELAARTNAGISVEIPVGVGFCLYIRHDCLKEVGELDEALFGVGYGEESDFCLRARGRGWSHHVAADVFVYHAGGGSFGSRRAALIDRSQRLLNLLHPGYDRFIADFLNCDPLLPLRRKLDEQRLTAFDGRFVLVVTLALEGGVERFVEQRKREIRAQGMFPLVLKPQRPGDTRRCELSTEAIDAPNLLYSFPADLSGLTVLLAKVRLERTEIQHFLDLDPAIIEAVRALEVPYEVMIHDYAWICPRITLIDGSGRFCGEPAVSVCQSCIRKNGSRFSEALSVPALRARSAAWLRQARAVWAPSSDTAARYQRYFPNLDIIVSPHTRLPNSLPHARIFAPRPPGGTARNRLRVALIGAIGGHKGYRILLNCARDAVARRLPIEFVVIGYTENDRPLLRTGRVEVSGRYVDVEVPHLLRREKPDLVFLPSVWPETWCYTLDHVLSAGLPAVAFDIGAVAERLREAGSGQTLLPLDLDAPHINDWLLEIGGFRNLEAYVQTWQPEQSATSKISKNRGIRNMKPSDGQQDEGLSASLQVLPLLSGLYFFSVKSATPTADHSRGSLRLPAMHVGLGPGVRSENVEFVSGPGTAGAWLFARGDVLVVKISGSGAALVLTSVRAPNGDVLSIEVERLESRSDASQMLPTADQPTRLPASSEGHAGAPLPAAPIAKPGSNATEGGLLPLEIKTHIRSRGDMTFADANWAGRVAPGLWMESFSIRPLTDLGVNEIEYKGLTGTGFETPWLSDDQNCGTKGMSVPLVGFAVRLRPSPETQQYDCEYSGYFQSGTVVGPLHNGAPCRSPVANDPLEGIQLRLVERGSTRARVPTKSVESSKAIRRSRTAATGGRVGSGRHAGPRA